VITDRDLVKTWCAECESHVQDCAWNGVHPRSAAAVAADQIVESVLEIDRHADTYVRWPWPALDALYGGMAPGQLHYVVGFSGIGKSTFIASAIRRWAQHGRKVVVLPLEVKPHVFRTYLACQDLGIDPGLMLSGDFWNEPNAHELRDRVKAQVQSQIKEPFLSRITVHPATDVQVSTLEQAVRIASEREAHVLVIDHVDHLEVDQAQRSSAYQTSRDVNTAALRLAQDANLLIIAMSQANQEALRGSQDRLAKYEPLRDNHVLMGGHKRQLASGMLGLFRPLIAPPEGGNTNDYDAWTQLIAKARKGDAEPQTALERATMGVNLMKSRSYGGREGQRIKLAWESGRIVEHVPLPYSLRRVS